MDDAGDEAAILARARADPAQFAPLYARYFPRVYRYCLRRVGDPTEAEDLTSAIFTGALAGLGGYRGGSFAAWLFQIAHHAVVSQRRTRDTAHATLLALVAERIARAQCGGGSHGAARRGGTARASRPGTPRQRMGYIFGSHRWMTEIITLFAARLPDFSSEGSHQAMKMGRKNRQNYERYV